MKKFISSHKETYGKTYGILVMIALLYFFVIGATWLGLFIYLAHRIVPEALALAVVFAFQCFYRNKIVNIVLGVIAMFFSILELLDSAKIYPKLNNPIYHTIFIINLVVFSIGLLMSGILVFSFMYAFKEQEKRGL